MHLSHSTFFILLYSLPVLEDLEIGYHGMGGGDHDSAIIQPLTSPPLTGTLSLSLSQGMGCTTRYLLGLQICTRIRRLDCTRWFWQDFRWTSALIEQCSETLQCVSIVDFTPGQFGSLCLCYQRRYPT